MKVRRLSLSLAVSLLLLSLATLVQSHRRALHEPLFSSLPSPRSTPPPPDQVFSREPPAAPPPGPATPTPPPLHGTVVASSVTQSTPAETPAKKVAIAASVGIVTLGMLSALAFYLCRHYCSKRQAESQKLVGGGGVGGAIRETLEPPPPNLFYIGAVEPSPSPPAEAPVIAVSSPYLKLRSGKVLDQDRYRPSPELQPLPPLTDQQQRRWSPSPAVSESEEEGGRASSAFYTPSVMSASSMRNDDGYQYHTPHSRLSYVNNASSSAGSRTSVLRSKRSSPKSRFSVSPIDSRQVIVPASIRQSPSPNEGLLRPVEASPPPPPPPPPPPLPKLWNSERSDSSAPSSTKNTSPPDTKSSSDVEGANKSLGSSDAGGKMKLKPLHWDKVPATSDRSTVWDQLKSTSFQLNEDMMETLFGCNSTNVLQREAARKPFLPHVEEENNVLDPKKSQNIAILLRALNVTSAEVAAALLDGNMEGLGAELLETLVRMAPTKEEEIKLRDYNGDISKLGCAERFLKAILDVPFAFKRVEAMLYRANFDTEVTYLRNSYQTLEAATEELKNCRLFLKLLEAVLQAGNRMNMGTKRGEARAFKLDTLLKLADVKGTDGKTTLLHFVVQLITESEDASPDLTKEYNYQKQMHSKNDVKKQELQVVAGLSRELSSVKKAAGIDSDVLNGYVSKLEEGLEKIHLVLQYEMPNMQGKFFDSMKLFLGGAKEDITKIKADEREALSHVKEVTKYFHGDVAKEEAHPLRIFVIVKDFLKILDHVCKDVGRMQGGAVVGSARLFQVPATTSR